MNRCIHIVHRRCWRNRCISWSVVFRMTYRITSIMIVVVICVMHWIQSIVRVIVHWRTISVIVEAELRRAMIVSDTTWHNCYIVSLYTRSVPTEIHRFKVLKSGERVELIAQFIIWHHRISPRWVRQIGRNLYRHSFNSSRAYVDPASRIVVTIVRIQICVNVTTIAHITNILNVIVNGNCVLVVIVSHKGL